MTSIPVVPSPDLPPDEKPSPELTAVWPKVLKEAETCFNTGFYLAHVRTLTPGSYVKPEDPTRGTVTLVTNGSFTWSSWNEKPQHQQTLTSLLAEKLGVEKGQIELRFTPVRGGK